MKIYQVEEASWYCGSTPEEAVAAFVAQVGVDYAKEAIEDFGAPVEVSEEDLDKLEIVDIDEPGHPKQTFRQALAEVMEPGFIATTEY